MFRNWILKTTDALAGPVICALLARAIIAKGTSKVPSGWSPRVIKKVLLIRPGGIGDMILFLPTIEAISNEFPDAEIDLVCESRNIAVLGLSRVNCNCLPYDTAPFSLLSRLRRNDYDLAIDSEQFHHFSAVFAAWSGASARIGFNINPRRNGLYTHLIPYSPDNFEGKEFLRLLEPLGVAVTTFTPSSLRPENPQAVTGNALSERISSITAGNRPLVVLHAGGSMDRKLWPAEKMVELITSLTKSKRAATVLLGDKSDVLRTEQIRTHFKDNDQVMSLSGELSLEKCAAVISMARLFVGPDSGLLHIAVGCETPSVAIFGPSDHHKWGYKEEQHAVVHTDLPCSPCFIFGYSKPCRNYRCINEIPVDMVLKECNRLLA